MHPFAIRSDGVKGQLGSDNPANFRRVPVEREEEES